MPAPGLSRLYPSCAGEANRGAIAYIKDTGSTAICINSIPVVTGMATYILADKKVDIDKKCASETAFNPTSCKSYLAFFTFTDPTNKLESKTSGDYGWYDHYSAISFTIASDAAGHYDLWSFCSGDYGSTRNPGDFFGNEGALGSGFTGPITLCPKTGSTPRGTALLDSWQNPKNINLTFVNGKTGTVHVQEIHP